MTLLYQNGGTILIVLAQRLMYYMAIYRKNIQHHYYYLHSEMSSYSKYLFVMYIYVCIVCMYVTSSLQYTYVRKYVCIETNNFTIQCTYAVCIYMDWSHVQQQ